MENPTRRSEGDRKVNNNSPSGRSEGDCKVNNNSPTDRSEGYRKVKNNSTSDQTEREILVLSRQIYPLRWSKSELSINRTTTPVLVWIER